MYQKDQLIFEAVVKTCKVEECTDDQACMWNDGVEEMWVMKAIRGSGWEEWGGRLDKTLAVCSRKHTREG